MSQAIHLELQKDKRSIFPFNCAKDKAFLYLQFSPHVPESYSVITTSTIHASGACMLYKSNTCGEGFLFATLRGFSVIDARKGTKEELRLAIGKSGTIGYRSLDGDNGVQHMIDTQEGEVSEEPGHHQPVPSMLILDAIFRNALTSVSLCIQRPKLLVYTETKIGVA